jgi:hypothetical protein
MTGTLHKGICTFVSSRWIIYTVRNVRQMSWRKYKTHILCSKFVPENRAGYEIMRKNMVERDRPQMTIWRMRIARWIPEVTNTHSEYVIRFAFPLTVVTRTRLSVTLCLHCHVLLVPTCMVVVFWAVTRCTPLFKKRPNFLNSSPSSTEGALQLPSAPSGGFWQ